MKQSFKYYGPAILWALFILIICSVKLGEVGESPLFFKGFDKVTHTGLFFTLVVLYCNGILRQQNTFVFTYKQALIVFIVSILFGGFIEILQLLLFTWRSGEWNDWFCDILGTCMGIFGVILTVSAVDHEKR